MVMSAVLNRPIASRKRDRIGTRQVDRIATPPNGAPAFAVRSGEGRCACGGGCPGCRQHGPLQAKLKTHQAHDSLELEADRAADEVVRAPGASVAQRDAGSGFPKSYFESRFGYDFTGVRFHRGTQAANAAASLGARAFTVGRDIVFGEGEYAPHTLAGRRLIAHELAHVIQQGAARRVANTAPTYGIAASRRVQRAIAEEQIATTPVETIMADATYFENGIKNVAYYSGELAVLTYDDGSEIRLGLVPEWIEAPFRAVDFKTPKSAHVPIGTPDSRKTSSVGTGSIRFIPLGAQLTGLPPGMTFADILKTDGLTRTITFTHYNGRIVPTEVNALTAPRLCQVLRVAEAEYVKRFNAVADGTVEVLEKLEVIITLSLIAGAITPAGEGAVAGRGVAGATATRSAAQAESKLAAFFAKLLKSGATAEITVEGVGLGGVRAALQGTELVVTRAIIANVSRVPAQGRLIHAAFERAAIETARGVGARTARVALELVQNPTWSAYLESQGYAYQVIANTRGGFTRVLTKVWTL